MRITTLSLLLLTVCSTAFAASPTLTEVRPRGGERGTAAKLMLVGTGLTAEAEIVSEIPGALTRLTPSKDMARQGKELPVLLEIRADAPVGAYPVRVRTPDGLSNVLLFTVGAFPEISEQESLQEAANLPAQEVRYDIVPTATKMAFQDAENDTRDGAQQVTVPVTINGTLPGPDRDYYRFSAKAGQPLVLEVESRRIGSAIDPFIAVLDDAGQEIARNEDAAMIGVDARVAPKFPKDGDYFVVVHDSKFSRQQENFYRLKIGDFAFAEGIFPLGWRRGQNVEVELFGGNLRQPVKAKPTSNPTDAVAEYALLTVPGAAGALPLRLLLSDDSEVIEPSSAKPVPLTADTIVNGRIAKSGEIDRYTLDVAPGETWQVQMQAGRLGTSNLHGILTLFDGKGDKLASTGDIGLRFKLSNFDTAEDSDADQHVAFEVPEGVQQIRVDVEDLLGRGGPDCGYRLVARKQSGDFSLTLRSHELNMPLGGSALVVVSAERRGYDGPIDLYIPNLPNDVMLEGGHIPFFETQGSAKAASRGLFTLTPKPGAEQRPLTLEVWGKAIIDGKEVRRRARGPGMETNVLGDRERILQLTGYSTSVAPWLGSDLIAMIVKPRPAVLEIATPRHIRMVQGAKTRVDWRVVARRDGIPPPDRSDRGSLRLTPIVRATTRSEQKPDEPSQGTVVVGAQVGWGPGQFDGVMTAQALIDGRKETLYAPAITFEVVRAFEIVPPAELTVLEPGKDREFIATLKREPGFSEPVEIKPENLPLGIDCQSATIPGGADELRLSCRADATVKPGEYDIELSSSSVVRDENNKEIPFSLPPFKAKVKIPGEVRAAR